MAFSIPGTTNSSAEAQLANGYPTIRLFTVGTRTQSGTPLDDLQTVQQPWAVANSTSISSGGTFSQFSSVCWFFGRRISEALSSTGEVPLGLISNNWGGTQIEKWATSSAFDSCGRTDPQGSLYNAMIHPYTVGPMALSGFTWYQGESNTYPYTECNPISQCATDYACLFPAMISAWRDAFANPDAYFGFIQLSTWCGDVQSIPEVREAQMAAVKLPKVGYATNADHGAGCNIHPPLKQICGKRLGDSALALHYGQDLSWRHPSYASAKVLPVTADVVVVEVALQDVQGPLTTDVSPVNYQSIDCDTQNAKTPGTCAWAAVEISGAGWINATVTVATNGAALRLSAPVPQDVSATVLGTAYGWGPVPLMNAYDQATDLPILPWNRSVTSSVVV